MPPAVGNIVAPNEIATMAENSLEKFQLKWRFTDPNYNVLPADVLKRFHPLDMQSAHEIYGRRTDILQNFNLDRAQYPNVETYNSTNDVEGARLWLKRQLANLGSERVTVSWTSEVAMAVPLNDFCDYWDDFCYPGSDDLLVLPKNDDWVLYFFHEELFQFGRRAL